ncbi:hypothetical protein ASF22_18560 [Methylobacterium sp. Leaf87]|nr:hypothetical protein ASF22_18560 [Methylobacterium sp. Leaf87]
MTRFRPWRAGAVEAIMAASAKPQDRDLVAEAAHAALDAAGGDVREATHAMEQKVRQDRRQLDKL